jgi:hypothetical protein
LPDIKFLFSPLFSGFLISLAWLRTLAWFCFPLDMGRGTWCGYKKARRRGAPDGVVLVALLIDSTA